MHLEWSILLGISGYVIKISQQLIINLSQIVYVSSAAIKKVLHSR